MIQLITPINYSFNYDLSDIINNYIWGSYRRKKLYTLSSRLTPMTSRRTFLTAAVTVPIASAGCLNSSSEMKLRSRAGGRAQQPVFQSTEDRWDGAPFTARVYSDPDKASENLNFDDDYESRNSDLFEFDSNTEFLGVFASSVDIPPAGREMSWCPEVKFDNGRLIYELPIGDWPDEIESPDVEAFVLTLYEKNGNDAPEYASVKIIHPDTDSDTRTCLE